MNAIKRQLLFLFQFSPRARRAMVVSFDLALCVFAALFAYSLRVGDWRILVPEVVTAVLVTCVAWLIIAPLQGVYRSLLRFSGGRSMRDLATSCSILAVVLIVLFVVFQIHADIPRTLSILIPLVLFILLATARLVLSALLRDTLYSRRRSGRRNVLVYGAGVAGRELAISITEDPEFHVVGFVDDNPVLQNRLIEGYRIWHASELPNVLRGQGVDEVLLALPMAPRSRRRQIVEQVRELTPAVGVRSIPNLAEIAAGRVSVSDLREIQIEELLGRDEVAPDPRLMSGIIRGACVMVTGAGGSIGSELSRQILLQNPSRIILAERSELALYLIDRELEELREQYKLDVDIQAKLVDVSNNGDMERVYRECRPATVFHAAAYKHVPLVESDPIAGIRNNVLGTHNCCLLGEKFGVRNFTLVSTDKAVRPTSVMGASKRVCELIVQARAAVQSDTKYSAVRFGNVLGSSGSVVPLFRRQIASSGPVTITHRDATRYFMTVMEAAQLVIQAAAMTKGGEIFLLDMGEPIKIHELAKMMIQLSGLTVAAEDGRGGDIAIVEIGLRPGEKLHEELLIDDQALPTSHPRIVRASEAGPAPQAFGGHFAKLLLSIEQCDAAVALAIIRELVSCGRAGEATQKHGPDSRPRAADKRRTSSDVSRTVKNVTGKQAFEL